MYNVAGSRYYYLAIQDGDTVVYSDTDYFKAITPAWGLWSIARTLAGPTGTGQPKDNGDGTWDYAIVHRKTKVLDSDWHMHGGINHDTVPKRTLLNRSFQQIEVRVGGDLEFTKGGKNGNELVGIDWNNEWDAAGNANGGNYPTSTAPDNWISHGYQARYGDWRSYWSKGYLMGPDSLRTNGSGGLMCRGPVEANVMYQLGDVVYGDDLDAANSGAGFYVASSATAFIPTDVTMTSVTGSAQPPTAGGTSNHGVGAVVLAGGNLYTCIFNETDLVFSHSAGLGYHCYYHYTNSNSAPGTKRGAMFWAEGGKASGITWTDFGEDLVSAKIAKSGVGKIPFEQPDLRIPILQELQEELEWDADWEWNSIDVFSSGEVRFYLGSGLRYKANKTTTAGQAPNGAGSADWDVTTDNPTGWSAYADSRGDWLSSWTKGYGTDAGSIRTNPDGATICRGFYLATTVYQLGDVVSNGGDLLDPDFEILSSATAFSPEDVTMDSTAGPAQPPSPLPSPGNHAVGDVVLSGGKIYTCLLKTDVVTYSHLTASGYHCYYHYTNSNSAPGTARGEQFWEEGGLGNATGVVWTAFSADYVTSKIATAGVGTEPFETFVGVGILDSSGSKYALSARAKVLRYISPEANPRFVEIHQMIKQAIESVSFDTLFAVDPDWLDSDYWRIAQAYAAEEETYADAFAMTDGVLTIAYNSERSNFGIKHERIDNRDGTFAVRKTLQLRGPWLPDTDALYEKGLQVVSPNTWGVQGDIITIYIDLTGIATKPWTETVKSM